MTNLFQAPSPTSSKACIDPVYTGVPADSSFTEDNSSPHSHGRVYTYRSTTSKRQQKKRDRIIAAKAK